MASEIATYGLVVEAEAKDGLESALDKVALWVRIVSLD
jgi:hypothetical protein